MTFLYPFIFFGFIPLFILYKYDDFTQNKYRKREKILLYISVAFALLALSRPVMLNTLNKQKFDAQEFIVAIDASFSMQATDIQPSRYVVAKQTLAKVIQLMPKNRFSIFAFTSNAILISPPTTDTKISLMALDSLEPKYILTKGTSIAQLLKTVSKVSAEEKNIIIFSDGGEDYNLDALLKVAKQNKITPFVVATGTDNGAILTRNNKKIKDKNGNLVISKINPILKDFARLSGGKYYTLNSNNTDIVQNIVSDVTTLKDKKQTIQINVLRFTELFHFALIFSIITFLMSITKIHQLYLFAPFFFVPNPAHATMFDFYHLNNANTAFKEQNYALSAKEFELLKPSVQSYYNKAVAYYKLGKYTKAVKIFAIIKTTDASLKQNILYNMGNCAAKLGKFERAKIYYQHALNLGEDADSYYNLLLLNSLALKEKLDLSNMLPKQKGKTKTQASKKKDVKKSKKEKSKTSSSNSNQKAGESSNGASNAKTKKQDKLLEKKASANKDKAINSKYKMGYKAYELINKGYTNEKHPW